MWTCIMKGQKCVENYPQKNNEEGQRISIYFVPTLLGALVSVSSRSCHFFNAQAHAYNNMECWKEYIAIFLTDALYFKWSHGIWKSESKDTVYHAYGWSPNENSTVFKDNKHSQANRQPDLWKASVNVIIFY